MLVLSPGWILFFAFVLGLVFWGSSVVRRRARALGLLVPSGGDGK